MMIKWGRRVGVAFIACMSFILLGCEPGQSARPPSAAQEPSRYTPDAETWIACDQFERLYEKAGPTAADRQVAANRIEEMTQWSSSQDVVTAGLRLTHYALAGGPGWTEAGDAMRTACRDTGWIPRS